jgi:hypothetical protein
MKPILGFAALQAQQTPKSFLLKICIWQIFNKNDFYPEN